MKKEEKINYDDLAKELYEKVNIREHDYISLEQIAADYYNEKCNLQKESVEKSVYYLCK